MFPCHSTATMTCLHFVDYVRMWFAYGTERCLLQIKMELLSFELGKVVTNVHLFALLLGPWGASLAFRVPGKYVHAQLTLYHAKP